MVFSWEAARFFSGKCLNLPQSLEKLGNLDVKVAFK